MPEAAGRVRERATSILTWFRTAPATWSLGNSLLTAVLVLDVLLVGTALVYIHYFGTDIITSLLYIGWEPCAPGQASIGLHCFGDFNLGGIIARENPWDVETQLGPWNYPAAAMVPSTVAIHIGWLVGHPKVGLILYLFVMVAGLTAPAVWASRGRAPWVRALIISTFGFLSVPALMAIDRGNVVGFAAPWMFLAAVAMARNRNLVAAIAIALAAGAKPQFALAILAFAMLARWRWFFVSIGTVIVVQLVPFLLWPAALPGSIPQAVAGMLSFGGQSTLSNTIPTSVSWVKGLYLLEEWIVRPLRGGGGANWIEQHQGLVTVAIVVLLVAVLWFARRALHPALLTAALIVVSSLVVPTSFTYYFIGMLPLAALALRHPDRLPGADSRFLGVLDSDDPPRIGLFLSRLLVVAALAGTVSRVIVPIPIPKYPQFFFTSADFTTVVWLVAIPALAITSALAFRRRRADGGPEILERPDLTRPETA